MFIECYAYRTLRSQRTKAQKLECDPSNVSFSAKTITKEQSIGMYILRLNVDDKLVNHSFGQSVLTTLPL